MPIGDVKLAHAIRRIVKEETAVTVVYKVSGYDLRPGIVPAVTGLQKRQVAVPIGGVELADTRCRKAE